MIDTPWVVTNKWILCCVENYQCSSGIFHHCFVHVIKCY